MSEKFTEGTFSKANQKRLRDVLAMAGKSIEGYEPNAERIEALDRLRDEFRGQIENAPHAALVDFTAGLMAVNTKLSESHELLLTEITDAGGIIERLLPLALRELDPEAFLAAEKIIVSTKARAAAHARHTENRAMKADVFNWLDDNFTNCKSMDAAAEAMANKVVPATFRTVRGWVTEWKKLRSASTP